jgi:betaine-aldehyde dehydrogenase
MTVAKEEIFGPVASVLRFTDDDEAIARANDTEFGLAAGYYTSSAKRILARHWVCFFDFG